MTERKKKEVTADFATPWKPNLGDKLEGIYLGFDNVPGKRDKKTGEQKFFKSYRIRPEDGTEVFGIAGNALERKFNQIPVGSYVWLEYLGTFKTKQGDNAHDFKVDTEEGVELIGARLGSNDSDSQDDIPF